MNYLKQILAFNELKLLNPLSSGQIALWHALMEINNKTNWQEKFTVPISALEARSGLSKNGVLYARKSLKKLQLIDYKTSGRNATVYTIVRLYDESTAPSTRPLSVPPTVPTTRPSSALSIVPSTVPDTRPLDKQNININKTKLSSSSIDNNINIYSEPAPATTENDYQKAIAFYEQHFGIASPIINESLLQWVDDLGIQLVKEAISRSVKTNKSYRYAEAIMRSWTKKGIDTLEKAKAEQVAFDNSRNNRYGQPKTKTVALSDKERDELNGVDTPLSAEELAELKAMMN